MITKTKKNTNGNYTRTRGLTRALLLSLDIAVLVSAFVLAYLLRFDFHIPKYALSNIALQLVYVVLIQSCIMAACGIYAFFWRYVGIAESKTFVKAMFFSLLPVLILRILLPESLQVLRVPFSVILMDSVLAFGGAMSLRVIRRIIYEQQQKQQNALLQNK